LAALRGQIYVIKKGDNLSEIAQNFNIPLTALIRCNDLDPRRPIHPGNELIICVGKKKKANTSKKRAD
jgi:LysM repeat protein